MGYGAAFEGLMAVLGAAAEDPSSSLYGKRVLFTSEGEDPHECVVVRGPLPSTEDRTEAGPPAAHDRRFRIRLACKVYDPASADPMDVFMRCCALADGVVEAVRADWTLDGSVTNGAVVASVANPFDEAAMHPLRDDGKEMAGFVSRLDVDIACDTYD